MGNLLVAIKKLAVTFKKLVTVLKGDCLLVQREGNGLIVYSGKYSQAEVQCIATNLFKHVYSLSR